MSPRGETIGMESDAVKTPQSHQGFSTYSSTRPYMAWGRHSSTETGPLFAFQGGRFAVRISYDTRKFRQPKQATKREREEMEVGLEEVASLWRQRTMVLIHSLVDAWITRRAGSVAVHGALHLVGAHEIMGFTGRRISFRYGTDRDGEGVTILWLLDGLNTRYSKPFFSYEHWGCELGLRLANSASCKVFAH